MGRLDTIILSSPRSGVNWVRYCIEWFSRWRTPGGRRPIPRERLVSDKFIVCRSHTIRHNRFYGKDGRPIFKKLILLIRNYKELYVRNILAPDETQGNMTPISFEIYARLLASGRGMRDYFDNIQAYDEFDGEKIVVYYEEIVNDFDIMIKILDFIGIKYDLKNFDINEHISLSQKAYESYCSSPRDKCQTKMDLKNFTFHSDKFLSKDNKVYIDDLFMNKYSKIFDRYLNRYLEENLYIVKDKG